MPELSVDRKRVLVAGVVLLLIVFLGSKLLHRSAQPAVAPPVRVAESAKPPARTAVYVDVVGAVRRPGLYRLRDGARVADAVRRAGGPTPKAQIELLNLAAPISDGEQVVVPRAGLALGALGAGGGGATGGRVHLNSATLEQLDALPGVGPVTAQKILDFRQAHGAFGSVDELDAVPGIGPARMETLRDLVAP